ncbi:MAG: lysophospholipid acyltransferase family protein [Leptospiraceae bacterium]|nr:lysophospholipid acyltransferase family protein [Leptospiraceae bacterium]
MQFREILKETPEKLIEDVLPPCLQKRHFWGKELYLRFLAWWSGLAELFELASPLRERQGREFIADFFEKLDFSYNLSQKDRDRIPSEGRLLVVANHPLGALDGLAILHALLEVRPDVRIVVAGFLAGLEELRDHLLPIDESLDNEKTDLKPIAEALSNEEAVIVFPSRTVSRLGLKGIRDPQWRHGVVLLARRLSTPILPVYVRARNSIWFYLKGLISRRWAALSLPQEILRQKSKTIYLKIGHQIPSHAFVAIRARSAAKLLYRHLLAIGKDKKGFFKTEKNVIHPVDRRFIKAELLNAPLLGETEDGMKIFLVTKDEAPTTLREVARLRELTFRKVGEGTGNKLDMDYYDSYYEHLILWDERALEVVGAYRIGNAKKIIEQRGIEGLYSSSLFQFDPKFVNLLGEAIELGRSFVQQKYWNSAALDYLWHGIGAYLATNRHIRYLFGPVSISKNYSKEAIEMLVFFYSKWFPDYDNLASHKNRFIIPDRRRDELRQLFRSQDYKEDFKTLKANLKHYGYSVPTLYKQYSELCEEGGVRFLDFGIDENFGYCVDGLILVDVAKVKKAKYDRYVTSKLAAKDKAIAKAP